MTYLSSTDVFTLPYMLCACSSAVKKFFPLCHIEEYDTFSLMSFAFCDDDSHREECPLEWEQQMDTVEV